MTESSPKVEESVPSLSAESQMRRLTRRSFTVGAAAALTGMAGVGWVATRPEDDGVPWPLRRILEFNESIAQRFFNAQRLAPEFPAGVAEDLRENGHVGLMSPANLDDWMVHVLGKVDRHIPLSAIKELTAYEMTTQFKCIEGWDRIVSWKGVRLSDFLNKFAVASQYIGMSTPPDGQTPDGQSDLYYVGLDRPSALHPQTLLCYQMNGAPLTQGHGAPLRLVSTVKYGYKNIKRIGVIELTDERPPDYWAQRGYDWYAGH
ncbi:MAG TPA: molybdopterin-dependent oxidoreductase [Pirellulales bacterium]|nr:molybdopterin-dependent oxidoreductase [Pirellulales bacterium]